MDIKKVEDESEVNAAAEPEKVAEQDKKDKSKKEKKKEEARPEIKDPFFDHRLKCWEAALAKRKAEEKHSDKKIAVTLKDGSKLEVAQNTTPLEIAKQLSNSLEKNVVAAKVNNEVRDATRPLEGDCTLELLNFNDKEGEHVFWHSSAHILGEAMELIFPGTRLTVGPPIDDGGFYYDAYMGDQVVSAEQDFEHLEKVINQIIAQKQPFVRIQLTKEEALEMFKDNSFKIDLIKSKVADGQTCTAYRCGPLIDLCTGPHVPDTGRIKAMMVTKASGCYWQGDVKNAQLQRVYGISFPDKVKLKEYKTLLAEAAKRDHRRIGIAQKLFFSHELSPGSAFFLPHGAKIYNALVEFIRSEYRVRGYDEVVTPNIFNVDLWKTSGHYANYKENMFLFDVEGKEFAMKPMNCPGHCLMFDHELRSYRDLPVRYADFGVLHRNEVSGALTGLTRVRRFQQDDAHIFCRHDQIEQEVSGVLNFMSYVYKTFGFDFTLQLSTRPEKFLGEISQWNEAEAALTKCLNAFGRPWTINAGDGAFYGPKIDIQLWDALKRKHQCATVQLDFQLPIRFQLRYKNDKQAFDRPVIIHRAILGSVERMMAVLIEHTGGNWPFWISPRQLLVVPVSEKFFEYANQIHKTLKASHFNVDIDDTDRQVAKKVREGALEHYNYIIVVGQDEFDAKTVTFCPREKLKETTTLSLPAAIEFFNKLVAAKQ